MDKSIQDTLEQSGGITMVTVKQTEAKDDKEKIQFQRSPGLSLSEAAVLKQRIPAISMVIAQKDLFWSHVRGGGNESGGRVTAVSRDHLALYNYSLATGEGFTDDQFAKRHKVCIIGPQIATQLFGSAEHAIGQTLYYRSLGLKVIGVIKTKSRFEQRSREILFPFPVYQHSIGGQTNKVSEFVLKIDNASQVDRVKRQLEAQLASLHRGVVDFSIETNLDKIKDMKTAALGMQILLAAIAFISLAVGSISIMNIMFGTIGDRIREIGVRKALGAQRADIFTQFLMEAVLLSFVGGLPGLILGASITMLPSGTLPITPELFVSDYVISLLFVFGSGLLSGLFPAIKAAKLQPIEALRY
jgi:ABC-type antimicrobial peptide transport system permease subunit